MKYRESKIDGELRNWFTSDYSKSLLRKIQVVTGQIRGVSSLNINLTYPITAFAGVNGAGKSTILALASCAYHANKNSFKLPRRNQPYYTFSDFFIQHREEHAPDGIEIKYTFALDTWKKTEERPDGRALGYQIRKKIKAENGTITHQD